MSKSLLEGRISEAHITTQTAAEAAMALFALMPLAGCAGPQTGGVTNSEVPAGASKEATIAVTPGGPIEHYRLTTGDITITPYNTKADTEGYYRSTLQVAQGLSSKNPIALSENSTLFRNAEGEMTVTAILNQQGRATGSSIATWHDKTSPKSNLSVVIQGEKATMNIDKSPSDAIVFQTATSDKQLMYAIELKIPYDEFSKQAKAIETASEQDQMAFFQKNVGIVMMGDPNGTNVVRMKDFGKLPVDYQKSLFAMARNLTFGVVEKIVSIGAQSAQAAEIEPTVTVSSTGVTIKPTETAIKVPVTVTPTAEPTEAPTATTVPKVTIEGVGEVGQQEQAIITRALATYRKAFNIPETQIVNLLVERIIADGKTADLILTEDGSPIAIRSEKGEWTRADRNLAIMLGKKLGAMETGFWVLDPAYKGKEFMSILGTYFNGQASADLMWVAGYGRDLHPSETKYDFSVPDAVVNNAMRNGLKVNFQSMFWGDPVAYPKWLNAINNKDDFLRITSNYVDTISKRYAGKVNSYVLVNEFFGYKGKEGVDGNLFQQQLNRFGIKASDFIADMSTIIHNNDPSAHIAINDFGIEIPGTTDYYTNRVNLTDSLLKELKSNPKSFVDTVGFQLHLNAADFVDPKTSEQHYNDLIDRIATLKSMEGMGYRVQATEMDVRMNELSKKSKAEQARIQEDIYYHITLALLQAGVDTIDFWGIQDGDSFLEKATWLPNPADANPLLFDDSLNLKRAYYGVLRALCDFAQHAS